ncbi:hypothetical protein [uncultured Friedmanniella sp.]|uniref:hypothetical protein n=1 Tax=uncultured Friedmanniella sp. TaxID=335381 RepID=UPI0035CA7826
MNTASSSLRPALRGLQLATTLGSVVLLLAAAVAGSLWDQQPQFPPPAANELLLSLRRLAAITFGVLGLATLPWAFRPAIVPMAGVGLHVLALVTAVCTVAVLRGELLAPLFWLPVASSAAACVAVVWAAARPGPRRS